MITADLIRLCNPKLSEARCAEIASGLQTAAAPAGITTPARVAAFLAQLAHESCGFQFLEEIWGPTDVQRRYEGRKDLGNTVKGDGYRYRGRGWIQLTGRANYQQYGFKLGLPLAEQPDLAARPDVAARVAARYWQDRGLNALADAGDFEAITRKINGGLNGWEDRVRRWTVLKKALLTTYKPQVLLVPLGGGKPQLCTPGPGVTYSGTTIDEALIASLRLAYPLPGGPFQYSPGLTVYVRRNGDLVLERAVNTPS